MRHSFRLLIIAAIFIAFACGAALAANPGANQIYPPGYSPGNPSANKKSPNAKTQPNVPQPQKNNVPAEAPGMKAIIREKGSTIVMSLRNVSQKPLSIKNEFMSAEMRNTSFVRVFLDQKETAGVEMFRKKMLIKNSEPVITLAPGKERQVLSIEFYNLPTGTHTMYASYSSQVPNYERKRYDWWLGTTSSNMVSIRVAQPELDKQIVSTGNKVMKEIVADLKKLTGKYGAMKGITTSSLKGGTGVFPGVVQLVFHGAGGMQITIQVRGADEQLNPYPDFDMKYPTSA